MQAAAAIFELGFLLVLAAVAGKLARRIGLPAVIGYLAVGVAVSPFTPGYVANREQLSLLADVGVVLLLFEVGIEINPLRLARERRVLILLVPLQIAITGAVSAGALYAFGVHPAGAAMLGLSIAMSSSVVVVNITRSTRRTTDTATDEVLLGWSVIQDLVGVSAALMLIVIAGIGGKSVGTAALELALFVAVAVVAAVGVPWLLRRLTSEQDLFLLVSVGSGLAIAGLGSRYFGVPLALAAFVAGLAITESPIAAEARRRLLPFRDVFAVMFFVALGTVVDPGVLPAAVPWIGLMLALVIAAKAGVTWALAALARLKVRRLQLAVGLGQIGEFSYVLGTLAVAAGLISARVDSALIAAVVISIGLSSVLVRVFPRIEARGVTT
jgi:CPA2 family monovalent cation:H+ antiporter-2